MKEGIHPNYEKCSVTCTCGNTFETKSTLKEIKAGICNKCHSFYTGTQRLMDAEGRIDKFNKKYANVSSKASKK